MAEGGKALLAMDGPPVDRQGEPLIGGPWEALTGCRFNRQYLPELSVRVRGGQLEIEFPGIQHFAGIALHDKR